MESRAIVGDGLVENNRVVHKEARARGIPDSALRFCLGAGVEKVDIEHRHGNQQCYYCGNALRGGTTMPHTYWTCPHKTPFSEEVEVRLRIQDESQGASARRGRTQAQANARRAAARAAEQYDDTVDDQTFTQAPTVGCAAPEAIPGSGTRVPSSVRSTSARIRLSWRCDTS